MLAFGEKFLNRVVSEEQSGLIMKRQELSERQVRQRILSDLRRGVFDRSDGSVDFEAIENRLSVLYRNTKSVC